jgi:hypothetical protein
MATKTAPRKSTRATKSEEATKEPTKQAERPECRCGCGQRPRGKRSHFLPGHDARLRGVLLRAKLAQDEDATEFEITESKREIAAVPDIKWAEKWHQSKHGGE